MDRSNGSVGTPSHEEIDVPVVRRKLTDPQEVEMRGLIRKHQPEELGLLYGLWNKFAVRDLIAARIGIRLPTTTLGAYLRRWGFVPEKALRKAYHQRPSLIRHWVKHHYPLIAGQAKAQRGEIYWGDEAREPNAPHALITITSNRGMAYWMVLHGPISTRSLIDLFRRAVEGRDRKLFLIVPHDPIYASRPVAAWLAAHTDQVQLFLLPGPVEQAIHEQGQRPVRRSLNGHASPTW